MFLGRFCLCLPRQWSWQRQRGKMAGTLEGHPTSCVPIFQGNLSGVASIESPLPSPQIPFLSLKKWCCQPQGKPPAQGKPGLRSHHQTPLSVSWDNCQDLGVLAGDVEGSCSDPICSEWGRSQISSPFLLPQTQAPWMSGFSDMKNHSPVKQVFLFDKENLNIERYS